MPEVNIKAFVKPIPQPRPRACINKAGTPYVYIPKPAKEYRDKLKEAAIVAMDGKEIVSTQGLMVEVDFYRTSLPLSKVYGDLDNLLKPVLDALTGVVYDDDSRIVTVTATKHSVKDADNERIEIKIDW